MKKEANVPQHHLLPIPVNLIPILQPKSLKR